MEDLLQVGVIASTHGIRGEVKVFPTTDDAGRFKKLKEVILDTGNEKKLLTVAGVKFFKQFVILKFREFDSINEVEQYRKRPLYVTREQAVPLEEGEFFIADLIGISVYDEDRSLLGTLKDILQTGANDVYIVETPEHTELLLPAIRECIRSVDLTDRSMIIHRMKGLFT